MLPISLLNRGGVLTCYCAQGGRGGGRWTVNPGGLRSLSFFRGSGAKKEGKEEELEAINKLAAEVDHGQVVKVEGAVDTSLVDDRGPLPMITSRKLNYVHPSRQPRQAWVENLDTVQPRKLGLVDLHPDVFGTFPRIELINSNIVWQQKYKSVNWDWSPTRGEVHGPNRKPWPQKGLGKARHGDRRSTIWLGGGKAHGPRGPRTGFYMLPYYKRLHGLCSTLSVKLAQDDLKIVDNLEIPSEESNYLEELVAQRHWGLSCLFVDDSDIVPRNIALATDSVKWMNIMPVYGLNVYSMLKHETLVLTLAALNKIETRLVTHLNRHEGIAPTARKQRHGFV